MGFREKGAKGIYFMEAGKQRQNFEGNRKTKVILWNWVPKTTNFRFSGNQENKPIYFTGTYYVYPHPNLEEGFDRYGIIRPRYSAIDIIIVVPFTWGGG